MIGLQLERLKMDFAPGDLVQLKSGGPVMTVEIIDKDGMTGRDAVFCVWFEKVGNKQQVQRDGFSPVLLEKYQRPGPMRLERG